MADATPAPLAPGQAVWVFSAQFGAEEGVIHPMFEIDGRSSIELVSYDVKCLGWTETFPREDIYRRPEDAAALKARVLRQAAELVDFAEALPCAVEGEEL